MKRIESCLLLLLLFVASASWADSEVDENPHGYLGVAVGPALFLGKTYVIDGVTGATASQTEKRWRELNGTVSIFTDLGVPTSPRAMRGTLGIRNALELSLPSRVYDVTFFLRYRYRILTRRLYLEPWLGCGVGFHMAPQVAQGVFFQLPMALGFDVAISQYLLVTSELQFNSLNPTGPAVRVSNDDSADFRRPRMDSYMMKFGIAYRFY